MSKNARIGALFVCLLLFLPALLWIGSLHPPRPTVVKTARPSPKAKRRSGQNQSNARWITSPEAANLGQFVGGIGVLVAIGAAIVA